MLEQPTKRVCLFNFKPIENFHGYKIESFDPLVYFPLGGRGPWSDFISRGLEGWSKRRALRTAVGVDRLYRERDPCYMRMARDFIERFRDFDLVVMSTYNFIHPELLAKELKKPFKVLGFIDDPISTYTLGVPYLWAFDAAFFISPSYIDEMTFNSAIHRWADKPAVWWPLVPYPYQKPKISDEFFFRERPIDVVYVGSPNASKVDRLVKLKKHFGPRLCIHGRWPLKGFVGFSRGLLGKPFYPHRVMPLTNQERTELYWRTKIGFNMHVSDSPYESGNMRTYEVPAHGMMMISDKGGAGGHSQIFQSDQEAVYYDNLNQAIEQIEYYVKNEDERLRISKAGYDRFWNEYEWESNLLKFLRWCDSIRAKE